MRTRRPIIGVLGSGTRPYESRSLPLGRWLASREYHLLTGGGGGVMAAVSRAFCEVPDRRGLVLGILPGGGGSGESKSGYPNPWVEMPIRTHLPLSGVRGTDPLSRNHINVLSSDVIVALPGSEGTASEVQLAVLYERPIVAFLESRGEIAGIPDGVTIEKELEGICRFVHSRLGQVDLSFPP